MYVARKQVQNFTLLVTLWKSRQQQLTRTLLPALGMEEYLLIPKVFNTLKSNQVHLRTAELIKCKKKEEL